MYWAKQISKQVYNNLIQISVNINMVTIFMKSRNITTSDPYILESSVTDKMGLQRGGEHVALSDLNVYFIWKNIKWSSSNFSWQTWWFQGEYQLNNLIKFA